ncbi:hypothetical protein TeGR_g3924, partial [Tetraparma gracilis]
GGGGGDVTGGLLPTQREFAALHLLHKQNCPGVISEPEMFLHQGENKVTMVYPMYPSDMFNFVDEYCMRTGRRGCPEDMAVIWLAQLLHSISVQVKSGIIHGDLKLENLLLDQAGNLVVCDYETSIMRDPDKAADILTNQRLTGTPLYLPPELSKDRKLSRSKSDLWALGVLAWEMVIDTNPWDLDLTGLSEKQIMSITDRTTTESIRNIHGFSENYFELIKKLVVPVDHRLTCMSLPVFAMFDFSDPPALFPSRSNVHAPLLVCSNLLERLSPKAFLPRAAPGGDAAVAGGDEASARFSEISEKNVSEAWSKAEDVESSLSRMSIEEHELGDKEDYSVLRQWLKRQAVLYR